MENIDWSQFKVSGQIRLNDLKTKLDSTANDDEKEDLLKDVRKEIAKFQETMYADNRHSVLICLQGMDTSGKDSLIREVFKQVNPRGVVVHSFKTPNSTELEHDYLWRHYLALPEKGKIAIFNRTHYENVLVTRVHPEYILNENLPHISSVEDITPQFWENRMRQINDFERHLSENGTLVLKFFFNISKEEQRQRLLRRLDEQKHNWKFSTGDLKERALWDDYMKCYEDAISKTSTDYAPWHIIPADDKEMARYIMAKLTLDALLKLDVREPELDDKVKENIDTYRKQLEQE